MKKRKIFSIETDEEIDSLCDPQPLVSTVEEQGNVVHCSIIDGFCISMDCEQCAYLHKKYPRPVWLCSTCREIEGYKVYAHWGDIECSLCGCDAGVKVLSTKKQRKPRKR